jgi:hypothetical protein
MTREEAVRTHERVAEAGTYGSDRRARGKSWVVQPSPHVGHTMTVVDLIEVEHGPSSNYLVQCSCGEFFRISYLTVKNALKRK